ncbi:MAG: hypothetical protein V3U33_00135 [candidate division NC10 bacterium]
MRATIKAATIGLLTFSLLLGLGEAMAADVPSDDDTDNTLGATVISDPPEIIDFDITNAGDVSQMHGQLDVSTTYYFNVTFTEPDSWSDLNWSSIRVWFDGGDDTTTFSGQTNGSNYRLDLNYTNVAPINAPALSEWSVAEGNFVYDSGSSSLFTNVVNENYTFKLAFTLNNQVHWGTDPANQGVGAYNDVDTWNGEVRAKDIANPIQVSQSDAANVYHEFGVFLHTFVSIGGNWDAGSISPGSAGTSSVVTVTHEANRDYRMRVWFTSHLVSGPNTITVNYINITAAGDPDDAISSDTSFSDTGIANAVYIWGSSGTEQTHNFTSDQETTGVQFRVAVPLATPVGSYVANLTIRVETP